MGEILFGKIARQLGYVTPAQLEECVSRQAQSAPPRPLGEILFELGHLTFDQLSKILSIQLLNLAEVEPLTHETRETQLFGRWVVREGLATDAEVNECLRAQAVIEQGGRQLHLGDIMVRCGYLTVMQVHRILERQRKRVMSCPACRVNYNVTSEKESTPPVCPKCQTSLQPPEDVTAIRVEPPVVKREPNPRPSAPSPFAVVPGSPSSPPPAPPPGGKPTTKSSSTVLLTAATPPVRPPAAKPPPSEPVLDLGQTMVLPDSSGSGTKLPPVRPAARPPSDIVRKAAPAALARTVMLPSVGAKSGSANVPPSAASARSVQCPLCDTEFPLMSMNESGRVKCPKCHTSFTPPR